MLLSCNFLIAQEATKETGEDFIKDSLDYYAQRLPYIDKDCGSIPILTANAVVRFEDHAEGFVEFAKSEQSDEYKFFIKSDDRETQVSSVRDNKIYFDNLPLDRVITLYYTNRCGEEIALAALETTVNDQSYIKVSSKEIFDLTNDWANQKEGKNIGLDQYILSLEGVDRYEKLSFIQDFFLNDNPYPRDVTDESILRSIKEGSRGGDECNCKTLELTTREILTPGGVSLANTTFSAGQPVHDEGRFSKSNSLWFYDAVATGPSKKVSLFGFMRGCKGDGDKSIITQNGNGKTGSPLIARLKYSLICVGVQQNPGKCDCEKAVEVAYRYDTKLKTNAITFKGWCATKDAYANAEDWAGLITEDSDGVAVKHLEGVLSNSRCSKTVNPDFIIAVGAMAFSVATTIATSGAAAPLLAALEPQFNTAVHTQIYSVNNCTSQNTTQTLLNGKTTLKLKPGKIAAATLFSFDAVNIGGYNAFDNNASINSNFYLSTMIPGGSGGELKSCCVAPKGDWLSASMDGPLSNSELMQHVNSFLGTNGLSGKTNVGTVLGNHKDNCGDIDGIKIIK